MKQDTKAHILDMGAQIVHQKGFNATGIQEVLNAAAVPKGSFYFYFKSKEEFGLQLIDHFSNFLFSKMDELLNAENVAPLDKLRNYFEWFLAFFEQNNFKGGCPIGNLAQEMGDLNDSFREKLKSVFDKMKTNIAQCLKEAQQQSDLSPSLDVLNLSDFIVSSWQGALLQMKVGKNTASVRNFERIIFDSLLKS
jgi:TetR/AcrR family transcriptional repressor of nem operon